MAYVITLTGSPMSGKSTVIQQLEYLSRTEKFRDSFQVVKIPKYTTRGFRENEIKAIQEGRSNELDVIPVIGLYNNDENLSKDELEGAKFAAFKELHCDLVYEQYGDRYGIRLHDLYKFIMAGKSPVIILNDVRAIEDLKSLLGKQCISLFVFRDVPNIERFKEEGKKRRDSQKTIRTRFEKANSIYRIYIENIALFDKMILNVQNDYISLEHILKQLIDSLVCESNAFV